MAGKVRFEEGAHASRTGYRGELTEADWGRLRAAAPSYVPDKALAELANEIMFAEADSKHGASYVPLRDQLAQLKKLKRLAILDKDRVDVDADGVEHRFIELAHALSNLDQVTLELIKAADHAAIQAIVDKDGAFVDVDGNEHRFVPPTIQVVRPFTMKDVVLSDHPACRGIKAVTRGPGSVWFPRGIKGFKEAVTAVIKELQAQQDAAGRREKRWLDELAKAVVEFWQAHCPDEPQAANRSSRTGKCSPLVEFAAAAFAAAGFALSASRLANLLHTSIAK